MGRSLSIDLPNLAEFEIMRNLKVVGSCWTFSTELSDTFRSFFVMERSKNHEKNIS